RNQHNSCFFCTETPPTKISTLSLHDALPIWLLGDGEPATVESMEQAAPAVPVVLGVHPAEDSPCRRDGIEVPLVLAGHVCRGDRSEEHTSELQSQSNLVCRLLLEKKKKNERR